MRCADCFVADTIERKNSGFFINSIMFQFGQNERAVSMCSGFYLQFKSKIALENFLKRGCGDNRFAQQLRQIKLARKNYKKGIENTPNFE